MMDILDFKSQLEQFIQAYDCNINIQTSECDVNNVFSRIIFNCEGDSYSLEIDKLEDSSGGSEESSEDSDDILCKKKLKLVYECKRETPRSESLREIHLSY